MNKALQGLRRFFFFRTNVAVIIFGFDSDTKPKFLIDEEGFINECNSDSRLLMDVGFLTKISEEYEIIEVDVNFNRIVGTKFDIEYLF